MKKSFVLFIILLGLWGFYRYYTHFPTWADEIIFKPLLFLIPTFLFAKISKQKDLFHFEKGSLPLLKSILIGFAVGIGLVTYQFILNVTLKRESATFINESVSFWAMGLTFLTVLATAINEEIVFRGFMMKQIYKETKNIWMAISLSTIYFVVVHFPRAFFTLHSSASELISYAILLIFLGIMNALLYWRTKNLASSIMSHTFWNFFATIMVYK